MLSNFLQLIKEKNIEFIDFRFTDPLGNWKHISYHVAQIKQNLLTEGIALKKSWFLSYEQSNKDQLYIIVPDLNSYFIDPFTTFATLVVICDVLDHKDLGNDQYDPRSTAKKAENYLTSTKISNAIYLTPLIEFFIFDDVRFKNSTHHSFYHVNSEESPSNSASKYKAGNYAHRSKINVGTAAIQPIDSLNDIRAEILSILQSIGINACSHYHDASFNQCAISFLPNTLTQCADNIQKYKYIILNVAHSYGKTASFMPKPLKNSKGSGLHLGQSLLLDHQDLFAGDDLTKGSELCFYYIGGILKHLKAINAFSNATTNSYKRLNSDLINKPIVDFSNYLQERKGKIIITNFQDSATNPYYSFAAILMAGIDGIENKIDPKIYLNENFSLNTEYNISYSLKESLHALENDRHFLTKGGVFSNVQIDEYIKHKMIEEQELAISPHPLEFELYYSS